MISAALIARWRSSWACCSTLGLARVEGGETPGIIRWAWAANGCASVTGAVLAALLAIRIGFTAVVVGALALHMRLRRRPV